MHEVSLVAALIDRIEAVAASEHFAQVMEIRLGVGDDSGVDASALEFCFPEVTRGSVLDGARLVLVPREGKDLTVIDLDVE
jgi:hydrogenase nickel incorporation protein HypA/HybF